MTPRTRLVLAASVSVGALALLAVARLGEHPTPPAAHSATAAQAPAVPEGAATPMPPAQAGPALLRRYHVALSSNSSLAAAGVSGHLQLSGELQVAFDDGCARLAFAPPERLEMTLMGQPLSDRLRAALASGHARVALDERGHHGRVTLSAGADPLLAHVVGLLAPELLVATPPHDGTRTVAERTPEGSGTVSVTREGNTLRRARRYEALAAAGALGLEAANAHVASAWSAALEDERPVSLTADEQIAVGGWQSHLVVALGPAAHASEPLAAAVAYETPPTGAMPLSRAQQLAQRAGTLSGQELANTVAAFTTSQGHGQRHAAFLWQATALLERSPEAVAQLEQRWDTAGDAGRDLSLDLLARAGGAAAQAAAVRLIERELASDSPHAVTRLQRLAVTRAPGVPALGLFRRQLAGGTTLARRRGAAVALGAAADQLARAGDTSGADAVAAELERDYASADPALKPALVAALGNAGRARSLPVLAEAAAATDTALRWATARAVRTMPPHPRWRTLLADPAASVQHAALESLGRTEWGVAMILEAVAAHELQTQNAGEAYTLLQRRVRAGHSAGVAAALDTLLADKALRPELAARLVALRGELPEVTP